MNKSPPPNQGAATTRAAVAQLTVIHVGAACGGRGLLFCTSVTSALSVKGYACATGGVVSAGLRDCYEAKLLLDKYNNNVFIKYKIRTKKHEEQSSKYGARRHNIINSYNLCTSLSRVCPYNNNIVVQSGTRTFLHPDSFVSS